MGIAIIGVVVRMVGPIVWAIWEIVDGVIDAMRREGQFGPPPPD